MKYLLGLLMSVFIFFAAGPTTIQVMNLAGANTSNGSVITTASAADVLTGTGVKKSGNVKTTGVMKSFKDVANIITTVAIVLSVIALIIGAIKLSYGGGNPQSRAIGIGSIICACIGAYVAYKAYAIVGWAVSL